MKKFLASLRLCVIIFFASSPPAILSAQTANQIESLLNTKAVTYEQAAWFVLSAADIDEQDTFNFAVQQNWLTKKAAPENQINLRQVSLLIMQAFNIKGGPMYSITKNAHYAYREMVYQNLIQGRSDPGMAVTGELLIFMVNQALFRMDENPWGLQEDQDETIIDEEIITTDEQNEI